jgi:hypothetical protein
MLWNHLYVTCAALLFHAGQYLCAVNDLSGYNSHDSPSLKMANRFLLCSFCKSPEFPTSLPKLRMDKTQQRHTGRSPTLLHKPHDWLWSQVEAVKLPKKEVSYMHRIYLKDTSSNYMIGYLVRPHSPPDELPSCSTRSAKSV